MLVCQWVSVIIHCIVEPPCPVNLINVINFDNVGPLFTFASDKMVLAVGRHKKGSHLSLLFYSDYLAVLICNFSLHREQWR